MLYKAWRELKSISPARSLHTMSSKTLLCFSVIMVVLAVTSARSRFSPDSVAQSSLDNPVYVDADLQPAASGHHGHGRVHIKVYRGPSDGHHASHGFWVKQPADDDRN